MGISERRLSTYGLVLPVYRVESWRNAEARISGEILGSCFSIAPEFMLTAGHVVAAINDAASSGAIGLLEPATSRIHPIPIRDAENLDADIGLLRVAPGARTAWFGRPWWRTDGLTMLNPVQAIGYPYGLREFSGGQLVLQRGFVGHVTSHIAEYVPIGMRTSKFGAYELSFAAPRGLSGAPLFATDGSYDVHGIVIGNSESSMLVFSNVERDETTSATTVVERHESLSLGLAVDASSVLSLRSRLLGATVRDCIVTNEILKR